MECQKAISKLIILILMLPFLLPSCGGGGKGGGGTGTVITPTTAKGIISGQAIIYEDVLKGNYPARISDNNAVLNGREVLREVPSEYVALSVATVTVSLGNLATPMTGITDTNGAFTIIDIPVGNYYLVSVTKIVNSKNVTLEAIVNVEEGQVNFAPLTLETTAAAEIFKKAPSLPPEKIEIALATEAGVSVLGEIILSISQGIAPSVSDSSIEIIKNQISSVNSFITSTCQTSGMCIKVGDKITHLEEANVKVPIYFNNISGLGAVVLTITYVSDKLVVTEFESGGLSTGKKLYSNISIPGQITVVLVDDVNSKGTSGNGILGNIVFLVLPDAKAGTIPLNLSVSSFGDVKGNPLVLSGSVNGSLSITGTARISNAE